MQLRNRSWNRRQSRALARPGVRLGTKLRARGEQSARIGVGSLSEDFSCRAVFDHSAAVHHQHAIHMAGDHAEVMRNEDQAHRALAHEFPNQLQDLACHGHVQRGGGLIGNQQGRLAGQGHGNGDALALAARKLVWIGIDPPCRLRNAHPVEQFDGALARLCSLHATVQAQGLGHLIANGVNWVQCRHRLLEDHADAVASNAAQRPVLHAHQFLPQKANAAREFRALRQQTHQGHGGDGLATARLTDQSQCFAAFQLEADLTHGLSRAGRGLQSHGEVTHVEQERFAHGVSAFWPAGGQAGRAGRRRAG